MLIVSLEAVTVVLLDVLDLIVQIFDSKGSDGLSLLSVVSSSDGDLLLLPLDNISVSATSSPLKVDVSLVEDSLLSSENSSSDFSNLVDPFGTGGSSVDSSPAGALTLTLAGLGPSVTESSAGSDLVSGTVVLDVLVNDTRAGLLSH